MSSVFKIAKDLLHCLKMCFKQIKNITVYHQNCKNDIQASSQYHIHEKFYCKLKLLKQVSEVLIILKNFKKFIVIHEN